MLAVSKIKHSRMVRGVLSIAYRMISRLLCSAYRNPSGGRTVTLRNLLSRGSLDFQGPPVAAGGPFAGAGGYGNEPASVVVIVVPMGARNAGSGALTGRGDQSTDMNGTRKPPVCVKT